ncbi:shikimate dehydrogenase family protein [Sulfuracidifex tepidarius]|uniref:Shikimate dehydrogenase (NADP(+)) n=1 Tax=Sulfuracidifex tepidarius TaxID=1294262 RepID=A0A510DW47_9CREN|nr:Shikimate dehydrogenase [Sulfuracidifex tepidarius]BBG27007.1 Shikimate dehydrogenase [Sulfuracidifex tepidarius]
MIDQQTKLLGVVGQNIGYTLSPAIHNFSFSSININAVYLSFDIKEDKFKKAIDGLLEVSLGLNFTIPYKERIIEFLDSIDDRAEKLGAVNTTVGRRGFNTDFEAVKTLVKERIDSLEGRKCLIYGAGGAARAASFALAELGCTILLVNRTKERAEELADRIRGYGYEAKVTEDCHEADVTVNTTPDPEKLPCHGSKLVIEFVYRPVETTLIKSAKSLGIDSINGIQILVRQALYAERLWFNNSVPDMKVLEYLYARKLVW